MSQAEPVEVNVQRGPSGNVLGIALFLDAEDLARLDVEPDERDSIAYYVEGGRLRVE